MKLKFYLCVIVVLGFSFITCNNVENETQKKETLKKDFRDFYGIVWRGTPHDNLVFAKQMAYDYVFYQSGMVNDPLATNLKFYVETPQYSVYPVSRTVDINKSYTAQEIALYEKYFAKRNNKPFPYNLATGWFFSSTTFSVEPDYQQQEIIDSLVNKIIRHVKSLERKNKNFLFGGYAWDVPQLPGDFWDTIQGKGGRQISLSFWTGEDCAYRKEGTTFNYSTYSDGHAAFYKQLFTKTRESFPDAKYIIEPWEIWSSWMLQVKDRSDVKDIMPDFISQEKEGTAFATDTRIFTSGLITKEYLGSTTPNRFGEKDNREIAATAALNGAWFGWYGRFGGTGDMPAFKNIYEVPARLQLVRRVANWDNLNQVPLSERHWDGVIYSSPKSYISENLIWSTNPKNKKIFAVWLNESGVIKIPEGFKLLTIYRTDSMFVEKSVGIPDITQKGGGLSLINPARIGKGYIITLK